MAKATLPDRLAGLLRAGSPVVLLTVGADGWGHAAMTWAVAVAPDRVRFGVDHGSRTLANLERDGKAALQVIGRENILALIKGPAQMRRARIAAAPFPIALWEMAVTEVKDQSWAPVVVSPLAYEWTGPQADALRQIEQAVLAELRDWPDSMEE
ncbi:MAG TPA: pyridoxamine 5'-phosphate oxidase family protein [bacterium]|nr:pyridoxamine 5'-phosphate oxidase family protein [bacterium]